MYRLYLDTCVLNDSFPLNQLINGDGVRPQDIKRPLSRWAAEYVALYHLLDLDDQWDLVFGTSKVTLQEITNFNPQDILGFEKKSFLEGSYDLLCENLIQKCQVEAGPISPTIEQKVGKLFGKTHDALHLCYAIQNGWEFFITTDFRTILGLHREREHIIEERFGIKARSPLNFIEENFLDLPLLIRTLYGSWTDSNQFIERTGLALLEISSRQ